MSQLTCDVCIIGGGSAGLSLASGLAQLGMDVILLERGEMGGDCLNTGCVPSKALLSAAKQAVSPRKSPNFGVGLQDPANIDWGAVHTHVHGVIAQIAPHDSQERFEDLGVHVIRAEGRFRDANTLEVDGQAITARRFVIATGSRAFVPPIPGLDQVPYLTNENIFERLHEGAPKHLVIIGGGPIGLEMAQAHRRLGAEVTVVELASILPHDDPDFAEVLRAKFADEGIQLIEGAGVERIEGSGTDLKIFTSASEAPIAASHLLVAAGRQPQVADLNLEAAGIEYDRRGVKVDDSLRSTSNKKVFAMGDVAGGYQFTHWAGYHASLLVRQLAFRMPAKMRPELVPWVTYTDPEIAHVGLTAKQAEAKGLKFQVVTQALENDRSMAERHAVGQLKLLVGPGDRVIGASLIGPNAGELIAFWALAITQKIKLSRIASLVLPYPTLSEVHKKAAGAYYAPRLFSDRTRAILRFLRRF